VLTSVTYTLETSLFKLAWKINTLLNFYELLLTTYGYSLSSMFIQTFLKFMFFTFIYLPSIFRILKIKREFKNIWRQWRQWWHEDSDNSDDSDDSDDNDDNDDSDTVDSDDYDDNDAVDSDASHQSIKKRDRYIETDQFLLFAIYFILFSTNKNVWRIYNQIKSRNTWVNFIKQHH
jgi:hypothetical protein